MDYIVNILQGMPYCIDHSVISVDVKQQEIVMMTEVDSSQISGFQRWRLPNPYAARSLYQRADGVLIVFEKCVGGLRI